MTRAVSGVKRHIAADIQELAYAVVAVSAKISGHKKARPVPRCCKCGLSREQSLRCDIDSVCQPFAQGVQETLADIWRCR